MRCPHGVLDVDDQESGAIGEYLPPGLRFDDADVDIQGVIFFRIDFADIGVR
jgi:hypothetical protein